LSGERRWRLGVACVLGLVGAVYLLTHAGRMDIIDGQLRYELFESWVGAGKPYLADPALLPFGVAGADGRIYVGYGAATLLTAWPLMALGRFWARDPERSRFLFSLVGPLFGAGAMGVLLLFLRRLGVAFREAVSWTLVAAFATLWWPASVSTFDQVQHGFFLLVAFYGAWQGAVRRSSALLVLGGLAGGFLIDYAESYALVLPFVGLAALAPAIPDEARGPRFRRYVIFGAACTVGLGLWFAFNAWRFANPMISGRGGVALAGKSGVGASSDATFGNPLVGALALIASPGKSVVWYCPPILLTIWGFGSLRRRAPWLALAVLATSAVHFALISSLRFFGGDWAWGPRYLGVLVPVLALSWPFVDWGRLRRVEAKALVAAGLVVQLLAVSVDHQRFFFQRELSPFFWLDPWAYFRRSALAARPGEVASLVLDGVPGEAREFVPAPYQGTLTYAPFGSNGGNEGSAAWMRGYQVFWLPRPWPFWMTWLPPSRRPFDPLPPTIFLTLVALGSGFGLWRLWRQDDEAETLPA
jgi:hypothetical protein